MRRIVFIADDLGVSETVNEAIIHAHLHGALHGAALMMGQPGTAGAVAAARTLPGLEVGWHVHLADSRPCTVRRWPWGDSPAAAGLAVGASARLRRLARREIRVQWDALCETGLPCRFVNAHHHLHLHPVVRRCIEEVLPADFGGWIRWGTPRFFGRGAERFLYAALHRALQAPARSRWRFAVSATLWGLDRTFAMNPSEIEAVLPGLEPGLHEFLFHPRRIAGDADTRCLLELRKRLAEARAGAPPSE